MVACQLYVVCVLPSSDHGLIPRPALAIRRASRANVHGFISDVYYHISEETRRTLSAQTDRTLEFVYIEASTSEAIIAAFSHAARSTSLCVTKRI